MIIDVKITGQLLEAKVAGLTDPVIAEKAKRKHFCRIEADGEWDGMAMRLIYRSVTAAGEIARESIVYNREAVSVPDEVLRAGRLYITAVGVADDGNVRLTTADMRIGLKIWPVALIEATAGKALSPSQYEELLVSDQVLLDLIDQVYSSVGDVSNLDTAAKENLVAAVNELQGLLARCRRPVEVYGEAPADGLHYEAAVEGLVVESGLEILLTVASTNQGACDLAINGGEAYPLCYRPGYFTGSNYLRPELRMPLKAEMLLRGAEYVFRFDGYSWILQSYLESPLLTAATLNEASVMRSFSARAASATEKEGLIAVPLIHNREETADGMGLACVIRSEGEDEAPDPDGRMNIPTVRKVVELIRAEMVLDFSAMDSVIGINNAASQNTVTETQMQTYVTKRLEEYAKRIEMEAYVQSYVDKALSAIPEGEELLFG